METIHKSYTFEIGIKGKSNKQIQNLDNAHNITDDVEIGFMKKFRCICLGFFIRV